MRKLDLTELERLEAQRHNHHPGGISPKLMTVTCGILLALACAGMAVVELYCH